MFVIFVIPRCIYNSLLFIFPLKQVKDLSDTIFTSTSVLSDETVTKTSEDLLQFVLSICPESHHKEVSFF